MNIRYSPGYEIAQIATNVVMTVSASGNNTVIAAPGAGKRLAILYLKAQRAAGNIAVMTVLFKEGAAGANFHASILDSYTPGEVCIAAATDMQLKIMPVNTALIADLSEAAGVLVVVSYTVVEG